MDEKTDIALEAFTEFLNAAEAGIMSARRIIAEAKGVRVKEETFTILRFEKQTGNEIGEFEVAYKKNNIPEKLQRAFNILEKNNATISKRYCGQGYGFSYWLYGKDKIYRQKLT